MPLHKNNNQAVGNYGIYEIVVNGKTYKIGKADLDRITKNSGDPTRVHQQIRKLARKYAGGNIFYRFLGKVFGVTTAEAKALEKAILEAFCRQNNDVPEGNKKSYKP